MPDAVSGASPLEGERAHAPLRTHARHPAGRRGRRAWPLIDRTTRHISAAGGQIVKVAPWGRRRLAYPIDRHREGSYHIVVFEAPAEAIVELERSLLITEEVLRHLVTRVERPAKAARGRRRRARRARGRRPAVRARRGRGRRDVPERSTSPRAKRLRPPSTDGRTSIMAFCKVMIIGNLGRDPEMRYTPNGPAGHPVQRRGQPEHQEPADRRVDRGDRLVPRQRLGRSRRARRGAAAQGQPGLRRGPLPDPRVRGPGRPEADLARHHRRQRHQPREAPARRRGGLRRAPPAAGGAAPPAGSPAAAAVVAAADRVRRPTTPTSTTFPSDRQPDQETRPMPPPVEPRSATTTTATDVAGRSARSAPTRPSRSTTRRSTASAATCPSAPRSSRAARPARAPGTSASWRSPSSARATSRCSRTRRSTSAPEPVALTGRSEAPRRSRT